jgi:hypothetical protein
MASEPYDPDLLTSPGDGSQVYPYAEPGPTDVETQAELPDWQAAMTQWIQANQTLAMALGFGLGVFLGVMMRD